LDPRKLQRRVEVREDRYRIDEVELGVRIREVRLERVDREVGEAEMLAAPLDQQRVVVTPVQRRPLDRAPVAHDAPAAAAKIQHRTQRLERRAVAGERLLDVTG